MGPGTDGSVGTRTNNTPPHHGRDTRKGNNMRQHTMMVVAIAAGATTAMGGVLGTTVVDFEDGMTQGWEGPQGIGGATFVDNTAGVGGGAGLRTQFNNFGIDFYNNSNSAFTGDFSGFDSVTVSVDLKIDQIGFEGLGITRPFMLELRSYDLGDAGYPWASVYLLFDWYSADSFNDFITLSTTFDPNAAALPAGWGGNGSFDPDTFAAQLPDGVTFADVLADVDEMAFSTLLPDFFFSFDDYDMTLDNITVTTTPTPGAAMLLGVAGIAGTRRRR